MAKVKAASIQDDYFLRRLHSLSGMFPLGVFMAFHLFANSTAISGPEKFNAVINFLRSLPYLEEVEFLVLFIPFAFHGLYGMVITKTAQPSQLQYSNWENWKYFFQRITGTIGLLFIVFHVYQLRFIEDLDYSYVSQALASNAHFSWMPELPLLNPMNVYWVYIIGVLSLVYHFAHGIWSFCITWGITVGKKSQDMVALLSFGIFLALSYISVETINHLAAAGAAS